jgi:hypothetical protein
METRMTREQLAEKLDRLDPGATFTVPEDVLAQMFGVISLSYESQQALQTITDFALQHRCTFSFHQQEGAVPSFQKDDVF